MIDKEIIQAYMALSELIHSEKALLRQELTGVSQAEAATLDISPQLRNDIAVAVTTLDLRYKSVEAAMTQLCVNNIVAQSPRVKYQGVVIKNTVMFIENIDQEIILPEITNTLDFVAFKCYGIAEGVQAANITFVYPSGAKEVIPVSHDIPLFIEIFGSLVKSYVLASELGDGYYHATTEGMAKIEPGKITQYVQGVSGKEVSWPIPWPTDYTLTSPIVSESSDVEFSKDSIGSKHMLLNTVPTTIDSKLFTMRNEFLLTQDLYGNTSSIMVNKEDIAANSNYYTEADGMLTPMSFTEPEWQTDVDLLIVNDNKYFLEVCNEIISMVKQPAFLRLTKFHPGMAATTVSDVTDSKTGITLPDNLTDVAATNNLVAVIASNPSKLSLTPEATDKHILVNVRTIPMQVMLELGRDIEVDKIEIGNTNKESNFVLNQSVGAPYVIMAQGASGYASYAYLTRLTDRPGSVAKILRDGYSKTSFIQVVGTQAFVSEIINDQDQTYDGTVIEGEVFTFPETDYDDFTVTRSNGNDVRLTIWKLNTWIRVYNYTPNSGKDPFLVTELLPGNFDKVTAAENTNDTNIYIRAYTTPTEGLEASITTYVTKIKRAVPLRVIKCTGYGNSIL